EEERGWTFCEHSLVRMGERGERVERERREKKIQAPSTKIQRSSNFQDPRFAERKNPKSQNPNPKKGKHQDPSTKIQSGTQNLNSQIPFLVIDYLRSAI